MKLFHETYLIVADYSALTVRVLFHVSPVPVTTFDWRQFY